MDSAYRVGPNYILQPTSATYKYTTANDLKKMILILEWPWETSWVDVVFLSKSCRRSRRFVATASMVLATKSRLRLTSTPRWRRRRIFEVDKKCQLRLLRQCGRAIAGHSSWRLIVLSTYAWNPHSLVHTRARLHFTACLLYVCIPLVVCNSTI